MNKKDDLLIRGNRNKRRQSNRRRNIAVATALSVVCIAAMAGVYRLETQKNNKEELLVNWEDNASSDSADKVNVNISAEKTKDPLADLEVSISQNDVQNDISDSADTSLLEADVAEAAENAGPVGQDASSEAPVGHDAVEVDEKQESTQASASNSVAVSFKEGDSLNWPVEGSILLDYSMDSTTYFATLDQYKYNPALLIQSEVGTDVCAAASGIVESIIETDETGITVTMDIGGGYSLVYGQLSGVNYGTGAYIEKGSLVGTVASPTKYYTVEGSNLYFEMLHDGVPADPVEYLNEGIVNE